MRETRELPDGDETWVNDTDGINHLTWYNLPVNWIYSGGTEANPNRGTFPGGNWLACFKNASVFKKKKKGQIKIKGKGE